MKSALLLLFFTTAGFAISAASLDTVLYEVNVTVNLSSGVMYAHIPASAAWQTVTPLADFPILEDNTGRYVKGEGVQLFPFLVEVRSAKARPAQDAALPLTGLPADVEKFMKPTAKIQSDDADVSLLARQVAGNASTELEAVSRVVEWVYTNVEYFLQEDLIGKMSAKEVLQAKRGVCGDFSVLTAALLRSLGIPAKYVNGELYTGKEFQAHAWLEVFVPASGWTPIDPTNGKVMPTASLVKIMEGADPADLADTVVYQGEKPVFAKNISTAFVQYSQFSGLFNASLSLKPGRVAFNQTVRIILTLENNQAAVLTPAVSLYHTPELEINNTFKAVVVPPSGRAELEWLATTPANLSPDKIYTFFVFAEGPGFSQNASMTASAYLMKPPSVLGVSTRVEDSVLVLSIEVQNQAPYDTNASVSVDSDIGRANKIVELAPWAKNKVEFKFPAVTGATYVLRINTSVPDVRDFFTKEVTVEVRPPLEQSLLIPAAAIITAVVILFAVLKLVRRR